ncbi:MAG: hypothetical protein PUK12_04210 [Clostridiales bacterium]|nr:hypothetical protein [Clostridiales bacterium]MDY5725808.1 hypothetical protein [Eubacteriales bacterium]
MWIEILAIVFAVAIVAGVVVSAIKRKKKGCTGCADCPYYGCCGNKTNKSESCNK